MAKDTSSHECEFKELLSRLHMEFESFRNRNRMLELEVSSLQGRLREIGQVKKVSTDSPSTSDSGKPARFEDDALKKNLSFVDDLGIQFSPQKRTSRTVWEASSCPSNQKRTSKSDDVLFESQGSSDRAEKGASKLINCFDSADKSQTREERVESLVDWFDRLNSTGGDGLSIWQLCEIVEDVQGSPGVISAFSMHALVKYLEKAHGEYEWSGGNNANRSSECLEIPAYDEATVLRFPIFADLILFDRIGKTDEKTYQDIVVLRNAIMRWHLNELVAQYAHIPTLHHVSRYGRLRAHSIQGFDTIVGIAILLNGLTIGMSSDITWGGWDTVDLFFTLFFLFEICVKVYLNGLREQLFGIDWRWNWFDIVVVGFAVFDAIISWMATSGGQTVAKDFTLLRLARLVRLTRMMRLIRVLRLRFFKELLLMVKGVLAGLRTLFWAIVMLIFLVYACGVLLRQTVGEQDHVMNDQYQTVLFGNVPGSMFTVFRCFMSDCNLPDGTPIAAHLYELYGMVFVIPYFVCLLFIIFGIFNMVTAVFVENVIEAARQRHMLTKDAEQLKVGQLLSEFVYKLASKPIEGTTPRQTLNAVSAAEWVAKAAPKSTSSRALEQMKSFRDSVLTKSTNLSTELVCHQLRNEVKRDSFLSSLKDPQVAKLIDDLEIQVGNHSELFDAIDSDGSGSIDIGELISGIMKMRSAETKQDVVALILGMRGMRQSIQDIAKAILDTNAQVGAVWQELCHVEKLFRRKMSNRQILFL